MTLNFKAKKTKAASVAVLLAGSKRKRVYVQLCYNFYYPTGRLMHYYQSNSKPHHTSLCFLLSIWELGFRKLSHENTHVLWWVLLKHCASWCGQPAVSFQPELLHKRAQKWLRFHPIVHFCLPAEEQNVLATCLLVFVLLSIKSAERVTCKMMAPQSILPYPEKN